MALSVEIVTILPSDGRLVYGRYYLVRKYVEFEDGMTKFLDYSWKNI